MRVALYSCLLYGETFIADSIYSILPYADRVFVIYTGKPWGHTEGVHYKGAWIPWPEKFDRSREIVAAIAAHESKVELVDFHWHEPTRVVLHGMNDVVLPRCHEVPKEILHMSVDCVFRPDQAEAFFAAWDSYATPGAWAYSNQVELWRTPGWQIPARRRSGVSIHRLNRTPIEWPRGGLNPAPQPMIGGTVHNLGFCVSPEVMLWKHKIMLAITQVCQDSPPNADWYDTKWHSWHPIHNNLNLEPSARCESDIPYASPYNVRELPDPILKRFNTGEWPVYK